MADLPFVIEPPGDPVQAAAAARAAAVAWSLPEPVLIRSGMNALFAAGDDVVLRVGRTTAPAESALWLAARLSAHGIRVPRYARPDVIRWGPLSVFAIAHEHSAGPIDWNEVGQMTALLHAIAPDEVRGHYPTPWCASFPWWDFEALLGEVGDDLDDVARDGIERALAEHGAWRDHVDHIVLCHGDVHPGNVLQAADGPVLIDWDLLCIGPAAWDHAPMMTWHERWGGPPGEYEAFATGYGRSLRGDPVAESLATLRLVAATLMRVRAGRRDPAAADEAERRLRSWRGDPGAPPWRAM